MSSPRQERKDAQPRILPRGLERARKVGKRQLRRKREPVEDIKISLYR